MLVYNANRERMNYTNNLACSGATTTALFESYKEQVAQLDDLRTIHPDVVTVAIGGDDIDFAGYFTDCYLRNCINDLDGEAVTIN